ncbi:MAG TPA: Y-family DNA polymerase [Gammaproteobacteria bacterium]|nr:Y-family DNA polymerase [Gammaproteobacteria bacterium]
MRSTPYRLYALVDCNNFFVSCERVFNPKLNNRPVVVLSSNDGCVISRSNEAKKLGIAMGEPFFKLRDVVQQHNIVVLSSNFALYGDLSTRIMNVIMHFFPDVDIYSIDEAFIDLTSLCKNFDVYKLCADLSQKIEQYTGVPVSIGIAPSKTLAKVANHIAKKHVGTHRVFYLDCTQKTQGILQEFAVGDVWGIGRQTERKLHAMGIYTVAELLTLPNKVVHENFTVVMKRILLELQGISCIKLKDTAANKQQIMISRSFGHRVTELAQLQEAIATYTTMACEKLRRQSSITAGIYVFLHTGLHGAPETVYRNSLYISLPHRSSDTRQIIHWAKRGIRHLFRPGFKYKKVGVILCDLSSADSMQIDLFGHANLVHSEELMQLIDEINNKFGRATVQFAAAGLEKSWKTQFAKRSAAFTLSWHKLPKVRLQPL